MENASFDRDLVHEYLNLYLQDKLESAQNQGGFGRNAQSGRTVEEEVAMALDRYQHRIWQLKDRLSCQVYGPHTEGLVDEFIVRYGLQVSKSSKEYLWILRKVLQTEIRFYTLLMQRLSSENGDECLFQRKVPGTDPGSTSAASSRTATSPNPDSASSSERTR
ncbi:MAG: hypothetical protein ACOCQT_01345 [Desulfovermiculus sp.]